MKEQLLELIFPPRCAVCTEVLDMEERRGDSLPRLRGAAALCAEGDLSALRRRDGNGRILRFLPEGVCI